MRGPAKKFYSFLIALSFLAVAKLSAQVIENTINLHGINFPQEKIHIHFDKEAYLPGETIWFKAYLFEEYLPSTRSTNFYASLYDEDGKLIQQQLCPIFNGTTDGHFQIPDSLKSRQLICRAYTMWMQNFDTAFLYTKAIRLINNDAKVGDSKSIKTVSLQFFPEGGDIIEGTRNTIAFKANYNNGLPFEINGVIKKQQTGEVIQPIRSIHDGMGRFDMQVETNEKFYAEWIDDKGIKQQTYLPQSKSTGVSLKLTQQRRHIIFNLVNKLPADSLHILMYLYQKVFYKNDIAVSAAEPFTATVPVNDLPSGIMRLTVFDSHWQPVAERVVFNNNEEYAANAIITSKETSTAKRGKNSIEIEVGDTIPANMSLSITDATLDNEAPISTIVSDLLLSGEVRGYINDPAYYFSDSIETGADLDLVMLTHGWRRYNWEHMLAAKMPVIKYGKDNYLNIFGQVSKDAMQRIAKDEFINLIVRSKDSTKNFYLLKPDSAGMIRQEGLVFYDSVSVLYSFNKNKLLNAQIAVSKYNYSYDQPLTINQAYSYLLPDTTGINFNQTASQFGYYIKDNAIKQFNKEKTLQAVQVKSGGWHNWKNDPMLKMDEKYTEGLFRGGANAEAFDVLHDEMAAAKMDIYNYIGYQSHLIGVDNRFGGKTLKRTPGPPTAGSPPSFPPTILIDEHIVDPSALQTLLITDVAYIKILPRYFGSRDDKGDLGPAVSIYLKKGDDLIDKSPKDTDLRLTRVAGYSPIKEFYSPDYSQTNATGTDARTTLLWQPYILTDVNNQKILVSFYNNDFSKKLRVVLEGFNDEGKLVHLEKIIE